MANEPASQLERHSRSASILERTSSDVVPAVQRGQWQVKWNEERRCSCRSWVGLKGSVSVAVGSGQKWTMYKRKGGT